MEEIARERLAVAGVTKYRLVLLVAVLSGICVLVNRPFNYLGGSFFFTYVLQPLLWGAVACFVWRLPRVRAAGRLRLRRFLNWLALICAGFHILFLLAGGMVEGFGRSPYSFTPLGILNNIVFVGASLAGAELSRAFLINSLAGRRASLTIGLVALFFTVIGLPLGRVASFQTGLDFIKFAGSVFFPALSENVLASYLAYLGGPLPAVLYRGALQAFQWFCPVLPDLSWTTKALLGSFIPVFSLILVQRLYLAESRELKKSGADRENPAGWIAVSVASVLLVWFSVGIFPFYPSVILSGSMQPGIKKGDIVLMKKVAGEEVRPGDIIQFRQERIYITHRVIGVKESKGVKAYQTKGDANKVPDPDPVYPQQVKGRVVCVIPKIGWATLALKTLTGGNAPHGTEFLPQQ
ncbi:MAG: signal peptidase I [Peptococcaceae bacterium]|nr:signal peptidase I [Peptococcaceae bacterium]